jgi:pimeloyl-ACP methyl ester carboxylesterase
VNISRTASPRRLRVIVMAAVLALAGLLIPASQVASAQAAAPAAHAGPKPTIVLEHGAWANGASWDAVVRRLQADGYTVLVPPNPLQGLTVDPATLADLLHTISGPIILVGHSYGGAVITNAATGDKQVKALVYVDAFIPAKGESIGQLVGSKPGSCVAPADPTTVFNLVPYPGAPAGAVDAYMKQSVFPGCLANGLPAAQARMLAATALPLSTVALSQPSGVPAWKTIPSWAVVGTADHAILPSVQLFMARRAHAHITEVHAPHLSMVSNPGVVTRVILAAVHATR